MFDWRIDPNDENKEEPGYGDLLIIPFGLAVGFTIYAIALIVIALH